MTKKRLLWIVFGFVCGVAAALLCRFGLDCWQVYSRYRDCRYYDYPSVNLSDAVDVQTDEWGTNYYWPSLTVQVQGNTTIITDYWSGQMRQYNNGVLFLLMVSDYEDSARPEYRSYQIHSVEECSQIADLLEKGAHSDIEQLGGRVWQFESGETFVN